MSDQDSIHQEKVEAAKMVLDAMHKQRLTDARLIKEYADQLSDDHPAKKYLYEAANVLIAQVIK